jgi:hypothetical protein
MGLWKIYGFTQDVYHQQIEGVETYNQAHDRPDGGYSLTGLVGLEADDTFLPPPNDLNYIFYRNTIQMNTTGLVGAVLSASFYCTWNPMGVTNPLVDTVFNIVEGDGLIRANSDYGYLLDKVASYGSITVPAGGFGSDALPGALKQIVLNPAGCAQINPLGWTQYGMRTDDEIGYVHYAISQRNFCRLLYLGDFPSGSAPTIWSLACYGGTTVGGITTVTGKLIEDTTGHNSKVPRLYITTAGPVDGSNFDVAFEYQGPVNGVTPWILNQPFNINFTANLGALPLGNYQVRSKLRCDIFPGTTKTDNSNWIPFNNFPIPVITPVGNAIKKKLFTTGMI